MKRKLKKITSAIAALTLLGMNVPTGQLASMFPTNIISASAAEITESGKCGDYAYYTLDEDGLLTIKGTGSIYSEAFRNNSAIKNVVIEEGITSIGDYAFYECITIETITIPEGVTSIGNSTFSHCENLKTITIPESVTSIGNGAFIMCRVLERIYCYADPEDLTWVIDNWELKLDKGTICYVPSLYYSTYVEKFGNSNVSFIKFGKCGDDAYYTLDENGLLTISGTGSIGNNAFYHGKQIKKAVIEEGITSIGDHAFSNCTALETITIPKSVTSLGYSIFDECIALETITIPEGVTSIDNFMFYRCKALKTVTLPESVAFIGNNAFDGCLSLETINIPKNVTSIGDYAFYYCTSLKTITIPEGVTSIGDYAFEGCRALETITIPESVTAIGDGAFSECTALETITIPGSVVSIGEVLFYKCSSLKTVTFLDGVTSINIYTFFKCTSLETITIPKTVTYIGYCAFFQCGSLEKIYCYADPANLKWFLDNDDLKPDKETICYIPTEYASAYVEKFGNLNVTFNVMPISIEENEIYDSVIESIDLNDQIPGNSGVSFSLSEGSSLPDGLTLADGVISGTPEVTGDFTTEFDIWVKDSIIGKLECTFHIVKAEPEVSVTLNKEKVTTFNILTENDFTVESNVNGTIEWEGLGEELTEGEVSFAWTFTPDDTNYLPTSGIITVNVELPKIENIQYNASYDLSDYDFEHIRGISIEFSGQVDSTTNGCVVLGNHLLSTALNSNTVNDNTIDIEIDQYSLQSAPDTLTICDWHNTAETLGDIVSVTFYYMEDEEVKVADSSDILYNADNAITDQFDLSEYDYENIQSVTLVFDGIVYSGYGAIVTGENGGLPYNFCMNRSNSNFITIDVNGTLSDTLIFNNYYNLKNVSYIVLNY